MTRSNVVDPAEMTVAQRRAEVASILALGLIRLRTDPEPHHPKEPDPVVDFSPRGSVHTNPASRVRMAIRDVLLTQHEGI